MSKQIINIGTEELSGDGESLRSAFDKINQNFTETYDKWGAIEVNGSTISTDDSSEITIAQNLRVTSDLSMEGHIVPATNLTYDLGTPDKQFRSLYVSNDTIFMGGVPLRVNGTNNTIIVGTGEVGNVIATEDYVANTIASGIDVENDWLIQVNGFTWRFDEGGVLTLPAGSDIVDSQGNSVLSGGGGSFNGTATGLQLTGKIPTKVDLLSEDSSVWIRTNNNENIVADIAPGIRLKRKNSGGAIYNSYNNVETSSNNDVSPLGTTWNADGWGDLADVQTRTYTSFYNACNGNVGENVVGREFVMHDTINDQYFKVEFTFWQPAQGGGANQQVDLKGGLTMVYTPITLTSVTYFVRGENDTNLGDAVGPGLTIKRGVNGGLYNDDEEAEWDPDNTPTGTLWNAEHEWREFSDITSLTWKPLYAAIHGHLGNNLVGAKLLMWDTINDKYYTVKFTDWGVNNGGSFAYVRREILPATGNRTGIVFADGSYQDTATTLGDLRVANGSSIENAVEPGQGAEIRYDVKNNWTYGTWAWTGTASWVTSGNQGYIQFDNGDVNNGSQVDFARFLGDLGRWYTKTVRINGGEPQTITGWGSNNIYTAAPPATDPTVVTEVRFDVMFRSRFYMGGENTVGFFLNDNDETFEVVARDINLYGNDDVRIRGKDYMDIRNTGTDAQNSYIQIVTDGDNTSKTWRFMPDGSIQLPNLDSTGWNYNYNLNGPTLKLGVPTDQVIITGPTPTESNPSAQRVIIQGQRGYGVWGQNTAGEGGDVYIWGGTGGESDGGGGGGGDVKVRGGQGQNSDGGYVRIEGGSAAGWNNSPTGGFVEINGGDAVEGGNGNGGDVNIRGGRKQGTGNNGTVYIRTGAVSEHEFVFNNGGGLDLPTNGGIGFNYGYIDQDTTFDNNAMRISGGDQVGIYTNEDAKRWLFKADGKLELPVGGDIVDSSGNSVLSAGADTNVWVQTFASDTVGDNVTAATSVEYDPDGNVIALFSHDDTNDSERYISVAKFDTSGGKLWQQRFAAGQYSDGWGLAADSTAIYVAGELDGTGSPAAYQVSSLMKLNTANGNVIWMKSFDFGELSYSQVVDVASDGNPVMVGYAYSGGQAFLTTTKLDKDTGNIIWSRKLDGQNGEYAYGMAVGPAGEIVVIGYMDNVGILNTAATLYSDPASNANWTNNTGGFAGGLTFAVEFTAGVPNFTSVVDPVGGRSVDDVLGTLSGTGFGGTSPADDMILKVGTVTAGDSYDKMLVVKYDSAGSIQWQKAIQYDAGFDCSGADADIDADGNIYICGQYWKSDGASGTTTAMSLLKMDGNGTKQWSRRTIGDCQDIATSVVVGPDNCLYLSGVTGNAGGSDYTFVIAKFTPLGSVVWQRLLDNTTTWTFGSSWFGNGGGSNIAVKSGYVAVSGTYGDPGPNPETAFIAQVSNAGSLFTVGDWDFKGASFSGLLNNTASDLTVTNAGKTDSDNAINITIASQTPATDASNFLVPTKYVLSTPIGDLTVLNNILRGTGDNSGGSGLFLAPGPNLNDMYFKIRGGDNPTHLHFDTGNNEYYDQYWGDDNKYLKLGANGIVTIQAYTPMLGGETWTFSTDRTTTIPGALIQGTVAATYTSTPLPLNVKFATNKLADGSYTLADGVEGQIMYLVPQTGVTPANVSVDVANFRTGGFASTNGLLYPFRIFNDANATYYNSRAFCTLIFTDGAWQQQGGSWD